MLSSSFVIKVVVGYSKRLLRNTVVVVYVFFSFPFQHSSLGYYISRFDFDSNAGVKNAIASTPVLRPLRRRVDEGKDEEDDEPVGVGVYSFSKVETDDADADNDADDGK